MYCKQCGHDVEPGTKTCPFCGSEIPDNHAENTNPEIKYCPACGTEVVHGAKFCTNCGNKLDEVYRGANSSRNTNSGEYTPSYNYSAQTNSYNPYRSKQSTPGKTPGICSIIFAFFIPIVGLILGIIAIVKGAGAKYKPAIILGVIGLVISAAMWAFNYFVLTPAINEWLEEFIKQYYPDGDYISFDGIINIFSY